MRNSVIVSSEALHKFLDNIISSWATTSDHITLLFKKDQLQVEGTELKFDCVVRRYPDEIFLYRSTIDKLFKLLKLFSEQPMTLELTDSETFNVKICEAYI